MRMGKESVSNPNTAVLHNTVKARHADATKLNIIFVLIAALAFYEINQDLKHTLI